MAGKQQALRLGVLVLLACLSAGAPAEVKKHLMANAGADQRVEEGNKVLLRGSGRVDTGRIVRFRWAQIRGPRVTLKNSHRSTAEFIAPKFAVGHPLVFQVTVTDTHGHQSSETATITVVGKHQLNKPVDAPAPATQENKKPAA